MFKNIIFTFKTKFNPIFITEPIKILMVDTKTTVLISVVNVILKFIDFT